MTEILYMYVCVCHILDNGGLKNPGKIKIILIFCQLTNLLNTT